MPGKLTVGVVADFVRQSKCNNNIYYFVHIQQVQTFMRPLRFIILNSWLLDTYNINYTTSFKL